MSKKTPKEHVEQLREEVSAAERLLDSLELCVIEVCPGQKCNCSKEAREIIEQVKTEGYVKGLRAYAWWKDGVQYVGTCGTTLAEAITEATSDH